MDTAISNGDFLTSSSGLPVQIDGVNEILQRALIRLTAKKGEFIYDRDLGSKLSTLKSTYVNGDTLKEKTLQLVCAALKPMNEVEVEDITIRTSYNSEKMELCVVLKVNNVKTDLEVVV